MITRVIMLLVLIQCFMNNPVDAMNCPKISWENGKINSDSKSSIKLLEEFFLGANLNASFVEERNNILIEFPYSDQWLITHLFFENICQLIRRGKTDLKNKFTSLEEHLDQLYREVQSNCVASTRTRATKIGRRLRPYAPKADPDYFSNETSLDSSAFGQPTDVDSLTRLTVVETAGNGNIEFLRYAPLAVTKANKFFVIVASTPSEDSAVNVMKQLKQRAPQFDYKVCAPYGSNPYYAIVMAAWVPKDVAELALALAKEHIAKDSYIWVCPSEGSSC